LFKTYILATEDSEAEEPEFFQSWTLFKEILTKNFGPPKLIEDAEDALQKLKFADNMKATQYFTEFAKYKAKTYFNDQGYYHIASQALPLTRDMEKFSTKENFRIILKVSHFYLVFSPNKNNDEIKHSQHVSLEFLDQDLENFNETLYESENSNVTLLECLILLWFLFYENPE